MMTIVCLHNSVISHSHTQEPGRWSNYHIPVWKSPLWDHKDRLSIRDAIGFWINNTGNPLHIRQTCVEPHCDVNVCPDKIAYVVSQGWYICVCRL